MRGGREVRIYFIGIPVVRGEGRDLILRKDGASGLHKSAPGKGKGAWQASNTQFCFLQMS